MKCRRNYYRILQVQPDAPFEVIRASYRTLMKELQAHPDLGGEVGDAKKLNEAYEVLRDSQLRAEYDAGLYEFYTKKPLPKSNKNSLIRVFCPFCKRPLARKAKPDETCFTCSCPLESRDGDELDRQCRRSEVRVKKSGKIRYYTHWPQKGEVAEVINVSPKGMRLIVRKTLAYDSIIKLSSPHLSAIASVKDCHRKVVRGVSCFSVGIEFKTIRFSDQVGSFVSASA